MFVGCADFADGRECWQEISFVLPACRVIFDYHQFSTSEFPPHFPPLTYLIVMADSTTPESDRRMQQTAMNDERKFLEGLLKERFNFFLVSATVFLFGVFQAEISVDQRLCVLAFGFIVFLLGALSILRTHLLVKHALEFLDADQPYKMIVSKTTWWLPQANFMFVCICFVITSLMLVLYFTTRLNL